ncbi:DUF2631 domain-containing protein [Pseudonocardia asaccharolytica]|uniref:DUF2631 domain-containing protein n=1 Tax=Pseudonocardia asaccharolytica DSM 44247 = NBRC 16224 TaxID=1123024 RepID=A0A511CZ27_9PSEU|nr:DUF2631 domain-containing protein [Pseudonocardia asaccharolytica]GEL17800.1 hypothetical protein PA7_16370 [Pseudonocardia asaccharolytica DSM 44247 = NBRC 16224]
MASNSRELAKRPQVDPMDEPSAEWGWHGGFPKGTVIAGIISAILLPLMLIGHSVSYTEILWMVIPALVIVFGLINSALRKRHAWRR